MSGANSHSQQQNAIAFSISPASSSLAINLLCPSHLLSSSASSSASSPKFNPPTASSSSLIPPSSPSHHRVPAKRMSCSSSLMAIPRLSPSFPSAPVSVSSSIFEDPSSRPLRSSISIPLKCGVISSSVRDALMILKKRYELSVLCNP